jgi:hypothetical protein
MKTAIRTLCLIIFLVTLFLIGVNFEDSSQDSNRSIISTAQAKDNKDSAGCRRCTLASLKGCYGYSYTGTVQGFGSIAAVGPINFDGEGNTSATYSVNLGGTNFQGSFTGTYTVNDDCTGTITINLPRLGISSNGRFVIVEEGKEAPFMGTDPGVTVTGLAKKL